jgi:hypothetical protein
MDSLGTVIAILNSTQLLIRADDQVSGSLTGLPHNISPGSVFVVFGRYEKDELKSQGVPHLDFPKGEVKITARQTGNVFLAERFKVRDDTQTSPTSGGGLLASLITSAPARFSAEFDQTQSLELSPEKMIRVGDHIGDRG